MVNRNKMYCKSKCVDFCWEMQGHEFITGLQLFKLGGCDIVLGVNWMRKVSPIIFDLNKIGRYF